MAISYIGSLVFCNTFQNNNIWFKTKANECFLLFKKKWISTSVNNLSQVHWLKKVQKVLPMRHCEYICFSLILQLWMSSDICLSNMLNPRMGVKQSSKWCLAKISTCYECKLVQHKFIIEVLGCMVLIPSPRKHCVNSSTEAIQ